jgi:hypothetical protein
MDDVARRQEVADIDRAWDRERENYMITGTSGGTHNPQGHYVGGTPYRYIPTPGGSIVMGVFAAVAGLIWMLFASSIGAGPFALFGVVFIAFGIGIAVYNYNKAASYKKAHARYRRRRAKALGADAASLFQDEADAALPFQDEAQDGRGEEQHG